MVTLHVNCGPDCLHLCILQEFVKQRDLSVTFFSCELFFRVWHHQKLLCYALCFVLLRQPLRSCRSDQAFCVRSKPGSRTSAVFACTFLQKPKLMLNKSTRQKSVATWLKLSESKNLTLGVTELEIFSRNCQKSSAYMFWYVCLQHSPVLSLKGERICWKLPGSWGSLCSREQVSHQRCFWERLGQFQKRRSGWRFQVDSASVLAQCVRFAKVAAQTAGQF